MFPRLVRGAAGPKPIKIDPKKVVLLRGFQSEGSAPDPSPQKVLEYQPPSLLERHAIIALVFLLACICGLVLLVEAPHTAQPTAPAHPLAPEHPDPAHPAAPAHSTAPIYVQPEDSP